jgi:hypothetical protein
MSAVHNINTKGQSTKSQFNSSAVIAITGPSGGPVCLVFNKFMLQIIIIQQIHSQMNMEPMFPVFAIISILFNVPCNKLSIG